MYIGKLQKIDYISHAVPSCVTQQQFMAEDPGRKEAELHLNAEKGEVS